MQYPSESSRFAGLALAAFAIAGLPSAAMAATAMRSATLASPPVSCADSVEIIPPTSPSPKEQRLLFGGRVAINAAWTGNAGHRTGWPGWYADKEGIWIRTGVSEPLRVVVPNRWRSRVQIRFANAGYTSVTFSNNCKPPPLWDVYSGFISSRGMACVPLTFELGKARTTRMFAIQSKPCYQ